MPVYEHSYQTWTGERRSALFRWLAIPKFTYLEFFKVRIFVGLLSIACGQFLFRLAYIYLLVNTEFLKAFRFPTAALPPIDAYFFKNMIDVQLLFCFVFAFVLGADLISRDLHHSVLVLYFSKPISRWEYFLGKFFSVFSLFMGLTWLQAVLLFVVQAAVAPEHTPWRQHFWSEYAWILRAITLYAVVVSTTLSLMILAASSLTKYKRYAGTTFAVYIIGAGIVAAVLNETLHIHEFFAISPLHAGVDLGNYLFHVAPSRDMMSQPAAWGGIVGQWLLCAAILKWRLERAARYGR